MSSSSTNDRIRKVLKSIFKAFVEKKCFSHICFSNPRKCVAWTPFVANLYALTRIVIMLWYLIMIQIHICSETPVWNINFLYNDWQQNDERAQWSQWWRFWCVNNLIQLMRAASLLSCTHKERMLRMNVEIVVIMRSPSGITSSLLFNR